MMVQASKFGRQSQMRLLAFASGLLLLSLPALQYQCDSLRLAEADANSSAASLTSTIELLRALNPLDSEHRELAAHASGAASYEALVDRSESELQQSQAARGDWDAVRVVGEVEKGVLYGLPAVVALALLGMGITSRWEDRRPPAPVRRDPTLVRQEPMTSMEIPAQVATRVSSAQGTVVGPASAADEDTFPLRHREFLVIAPKPVSAEELAAAIVSIDGRAQGSENEYSTPSFDLIEIQSRSDVSYFSLDSKHDEPAVTTAWPEIVPGVRLQVLLQISASAFLDAFEVQALSVATSIRSGKLEGASFAGLTGHLSGFAFRIPTPLRDAIMAASLGPSSSAPGEVPEPDEDDLAQLEVDTYLSMLTEEDLRAITLGSGIEIPGVESTTSI